MVESLIPSVDDFTMSELMNLVDELAHEADKGAENPDEKEAQIETGDKADTKSH